MFKFGKYVFESFKEFQQVLSLATANGVGTGEEFFDFLSANYSHKLIKSNWGGNMKLTDEQIEKIYQSFDCLIPKSLIKKVLKKVLNEN